MKSNTVSLSALGRYLLNWLKKWLRNVVVGIIFHLHFKSYIGGYKGFVAIDPTSSTKLSLKKSIMYKYKLENTKFNVLAWSKCKPC